MNTTEPSSNTTAVVDLLATGRMQGISLAEIAQHVHMSYVRFASKIQGRFIRYPSSVENKAKWYDEEDYRRFKYTLVRDAVKVSANVAAARVDQGFAEELILRCVGLDHLISRDVPARIRAVWNTRMTHVKLVLMAQKLQRLNGIGGPEDLARVASDSSRGSRERAHEIAVLFASVH